jgi:hypothetical protein
VKPPCVHRWRLESPVGNEVAGKCALCGRTRSFPADHAWREPTLEERAQLRVIRATEIEETDTND